MWPALLDVSVQRGHHAWELTDDRDTAASDKAER